MIKHDKHLETEGVDAIEMNLEVPSSSARIFSVQH
jgi:hypothetical protein